MGDEKTVTVAVDFRLPKDNGARKAFESAMQSLADQVLEAAARLCDETAQTCNGLAAGSPDEMAYSREALCATGLASRIRALKVSVESSPGE